MRGPAPSLECPRCGATSPPSAELGPFTTCRDCGLSFDAAPRERQVPLRRAPSEPEPEPEPPPRRPRARPWWLIAAVLGAAIIVPRLSKDPDPYRTHRRELERDLQIRNAQLWSTLHDVASDLACPQLERLLARHCASPEEDEALLDAIANANTAGPDACERMVAAADAAERRLRCE